MKEHLCFKSLKIGKRPNFLALILLLITINSLAQFEDAAWKQVTGFNTGAFSELVEREGFLFTAFHDGIYRSSDDGNTWNPMSINSSLSTTQNFSRWRLARNSNNIFMYEMKNKQVHLSSNNGESWQSANMNIPSTCFVSPGLKFYDDIIFLVDEAYYNYRYSSACNISFYYSLDMGASWTSVNMGEYKSEYGFMYQVFAYNIVSLNNKFWASTENGIYSSTNLSSWTHELSTGVLVFSKFNFSGENNGLFACMKGLASAYIKNDAYYSGHQLKKFNFQTNQWEDNFIDPTIISSTSALTNKLNFTKAGDKLFIYGDWGSYRSDNEGASWTKIVNAKPFNDVPEYAGNVSSLVVAMEKKGSKLIASMGLCGLWTSTDDGIHWNRLATSNVDRPWYSFFYPESASGDLLIFTLGGAFRLKPDDSIIKIADLSISSFAMHGTRYIAGTHVGVFISDDEGQTWTKTFSQLVSNVYSYQNKIYALKGNINNSSQPSTLFVSSDGGLTWQADQSNLPKNKGKYFLESDGKLLASGWGVYISADGGSSWQPAASHPAGMVTSFKSVNNKLYICTSSGLYASEDNGLNWANIYSVSDVNDVAWFNGALIISTATSGTASTFASTDNGLSWQQLPNPFPSNEYFYAGYGFGNFTLHNGELIGASKEEIWKLTSESDLVKISASHQSSKKNVPVVVPITTENFSNIIGLQMTIEWDPSILQFVNVEQFEINGVTPNSFGTDLVNQGKLTFSWSSPLLIPQAGQNLFGIKFKPVGSPGSSSAVTINGSEIPVEVIDVNYTSVDYETIAGSVSIEANSHVSGTIKHHDRPLAETTVHASENGVEPIYSALTSSSGTYTLEVPADLTYTIKSEKLPSNYSDYLNAADVAAIHRHILKTEQLNDPFLIIAADVNQSKSVTTLDMILVEAIILGIKENFPSNLQWEFIPSDFSLVDPLNPFIYPNFKTITSIIEDEQLDFTAIHYGDVHDSNESPTGRESASEYIMEIASEQSGDQLKAYVRGYGFKDVSATQFSLKWDQSLLEFKEIKNGSLNLRVNSAKVSEGVIHTLSDADNGYAQFISDGATLFEITFTLKQTDKSINQSINFSNDIITPLVFNKDLKSHTPSLRWTDGDFTFSTAIGQPFPNPFTNEITVPISIEEPIEIDLLMTDVLGRVVKHSINSYSKGTHDIKFSTAPFLEAGVYILQVRAGVLLEAFKVVKK